MERRRVESQLIACYTLIMALFGIYVRWLASYDPWAALAAGLVLGLVLLASLVYKLIQLRGGRAS